MALQVVDLIDTWLLLRTRSVVEFCVEWLSLPQRVLERILGMAYVVGLVAWHVLDHMVWWVMLLFALVVSGMVVKHCLPDRERLQLLLIGDGAGGRVIAAVVAFLCAPINLFVVRTPPALCAANTYLTFAAFVFLVALPASGTPGRRRRRAIEKLAKILETSPSPAGGAA